MHFQMKIQPIDSNTVKGLIRNDPVKPVVKSRFKRLLERQFPGVLRISSAEKQGHGETQNNKDVVGGDLEPSSVCLAKMVQSFIEETNEKPSVKCGRNCFNGNCTDSSDDEFEFCCGGFGETITSSSSSETCEILKSLVPCPSISERNLLADTAKIVEKNKICKRKDDCRKIVTDGLLILGYDAAICKSRWEKSHGYPAGEYEYIDVIIDGERLLVDIDFRSEFEIARSTKNYKSILQILPSIFVGKSDRLQQIVTMVSEAAKQSLKKKGMHLPPWRKADYMRSKWLSSHTRTPIPVKETEEEQPEKNQKEVEKIDNQQTNSCLIKTKNFSGEFELIFQDKKSQSGLDSGVALASFPEENPEEGTDKIKVVVSPWQPPAIKPKNSQRGGKIVTGLASVLKEKP